jgi:HlyD family secretion protein
MKQRRIVLLSVVIAAATGLGAWAHLRGERSDEFRAVTIDRGPITSTISATGSLNAVVTVEVGAQVSGNIRDLYADFNTRVKKGQLVARIDPEIFQARVNQAQANLEAARSAVANARAAQAKSVADVSSARAQAAIAKANLAKEKVNAADAKTKYTRQADLFAAGLIATSDRDTARAAFDAQQAAVSAAEAQVQAAQEAVRSAQAQEEIAAAQVNSAQAQVQQQTAALRQTQIDLDHTYIYAPVDGIVISRKVDAGQTVVASMQAPALFEIAQDLTRMQVDTNVDEADVGAVKVGQNAVFTVDAYPTQRFHGKVVEIRKAPINVQNVVTYDVVIAVSNPDLKLFPGMTANVNVQVDHRDDALRVPNAAMRFRPVDAKPANAAGPAGAHPMRHGPPTQTVYVLENGQPVAVPVQLGITDGVHTEVAGGNLRQGQEVITGYAPNSKDAQAANRPRGGPRF